MINVRRDLFIRPANKILNYIDMHLIGDPSGGMKVYLGTTQPIENMSEGSFKAMVAHLDQGRYD